MSIAIHVLCRKPGLTRAKLIEYIEDEIDFCDDLDPRFEPGDGSEELDQERWDKLDVHYGDDELLQFWLANADVIEGTVDEVIAQHLAGKRDRKAADLAARLKETRLMVTVRVGFGGGKVERAVWDMLAVVETCVATDYDGVVVAAEGIYDAGLNLLVGF